MLPSSYSVYVHSIPCAEAALLKYNEQLCAAAVSVGVVWYTSGLGYVMSVMLEPQNSMVASVAVCLVLGGFFNGIEPRFRTLSSFMKVVFGANPLPLNLDNTSFPLA